LEADPRSIKKRGKKGERDNWYEWSGPKYSKFHRWAHEERRKQLSKPQIKKWFDEWDALGRPDANEIIEEL
jgi:hypothetical protein